MRIIEVLLASTAVEALSDDPPVLGSVTAFTCVQGSAATADAVVEAFMGLLRTRRLRATFSRISYVTFADLRKKALLCWRGLF
jgi:hypothetical protein